MTNRVEILADGKPYRPRKPIETQFVEDGWGDVIWFVVWRTHDIAEAERRALREVPGHMGPVTVPEPKQVWLKVVPWDAFGHGYDRSIIEVEPRHGTPCVEYRFT